ncbi:MAG TPA: SMC-Scp complex subunit ScpB, partial [Methanomassiliicoccales archaeon]|nr:SMC-Scp complex subunit ScpB [Methanomassiliicoccales archaeon]
MDRAVEAVLFAASQPLRAADIADILGVGPEAVRKEIRLLDKEYEERGTAFEIAKIGQRYSLQLRQEYNQYALPFADLDMSPEVLKAAS